MTPEQERAYNDLFNLTSTNGWKLFIEEDINPVYEANLAALKTSTDTVMIGRYQKAIEFCEWVKNYRSWKEMEYEQLKEEEYNEPKGL